MKLGMRYEKCTQKFNGKASRNAILARVNEKIILISKSNL
jgi:hypothetical protein